MWNHYRKTFKSMQVTIAVFVAAVYVFFGRRWEAAAVFFVVMQAGALVGAVWAARLKARITAAREALPLRAVA